MEQEEKIKTVATAMGSSMKQQASGGYKEKTIDTHAETTQVERNIADWSAAAKKAVEHTIQKYGPPNEATQSRLIWYNTGPWKRTVITWNEIPHNFPQCRMLM